MGENTKPIVREDGKLLVHAVPVQVQCDGYRCLAYRDQDGRWINYHNGAPIEGTVRPVEFQLD